MGSSKGRIGRGDVVDVAMQALRWQMEETMRDVWGVTALILAAASLFGLGYAVNGLANGITELPRHSSSTAPVLGLGLSTCLSGVARRRGRSSSPKEW